MIITTLDELRSYFKVVEDAPDPDGPGDAEQLLGPILEALQCWDETELGALLLHLGLILAVRKGPEGVQALHVTLTEMAEVLMQREIWGSLN